MMMVSSMLTMSCEKEQIEEVIPESNSMSVGQYSASSFTANLTGTFDGVIRSCVTSIQPSPRRGTDPAR